MTEFWTVLSRGQRTVVLCLNVSWMQSSFDLVLKQVLLGCFICSVNKLSPTGSTYALLSSISPTPSRFWTHVRAADEMTVALNRHLCTSYSACVLGALWTKMVCRLHRSLLYSCTWANQFSCWQATFPLRACLVCAEWKAVWAPQKRSAT